LSKEPDLSDVLKSLPARPGVYLMKNAQGQVIYVGKAKSLRSRVRSYFRQVDSKDPKTRLLVSRIRGIDFLVTDTEKEALIAENNLIKEHKPRYNVQLRDDKNYLCLKLTVSEKFPRMILVRRILQDGGLYFGPFDSARSVRDTLRLINRTFPLRSCTGVQFARRTRPCVQHQIGRCRAPCSGLISPEDYARIVQDVRLFLEGRDTDLIASLTERMQRLSEAMEFEEAARLRDRIQAVRRTLEKQKAVSPGLEDRDVVNLYREGGLVTVAVIFVRKGKIVGARDYGFSGLELPDREIVDSFVKQFYASEKVIPDELLVPSLPEEHEAVADLLRDLAGHPVRLLSPVRGDKARLLEMAGENARARFRSRRERTDDLADALEEIARKLRLEGPPEIIDCFDISNISGTLAVGSKVRFRGGEPDKSGYRRFRIRTVHGPDDYAMMREVLGRWVEQVRREGEYPNLVLVDGGRGQLGVASRVFGDLDYVSSALASIAKGGGAHETDHFYLPERKNPVLFKRNSSALFLLQRVRDEAHRFGIEYHRKLRRRRGLSSVLDSIPGVGPKRKAALVKAFGSLERLRRASEEQIAQVRGIPETLARSIREHLEAPDGNAGPPGEA